MASRRLPAPHRDARDAEQRRAIRPPERVLGRATGAVPGAGCGKAVERAVWNVTLPSTFCMSW